MRRSHSQTKLLSSGTLNGTQYLYSRAVQWPTLLTVEHTVDINKVTLDLPNQKTITMDAQRTRSTIFSKQLQQQLCCLLTYFAKEYQIYYKQGLNELAAPFIVLMNAGLPLQTIYGMFNKYIQLYMGNYFDDEFVSVQNIFMCYNVLLQYHDAQLSEYLKQHHMTAELYVTPWFITHFISKSSLEVAQLIIEHQLIANDKYFIFYFCIAIMLQYRDTILKSEYSNLPMLLTGIRIDSVESFYNTLQLALQIRWSTPKYFIELLDSSNICRPGVQVLLKVFPTMMVNTEDILIKLSIHHQPWDCQVDTNIQLMNPLIQQILKVYSQQRPVHFQPILIFKDMPQESLTLLSSKLSQVVIIMQSQCSNNRIYQKLCNLQLTNKLWICLMPECVNEMPEMVRDMDRVCISILSQDDILDIICHQI